MLVYNPKKEFLLKVVYFFFLFTGAVLTIGVAPVNFSSFQLGQIFGTLALSGLTLQLLMGARIKLLEKGVGLDRILRWHSFNARLTAFFIILHPSFIFGPSLLRGLSVKDLLASFSLYHWMGVIALILIICIIISTIYQSRINLNYEHWKIIHKASYLIIVLGFIHSLFVGSDVTSGRPLYYWWLILVSLSLFAVIYRYGVRKWFSRNNLYRITKIIKESPDVRSIFLKPFSGKIFSSFPGQFAFVKFFSQNLPPEEHHFTISSSLNNEIAFTIKESGDFTKQLGKLKVGDKAKIEGPFGVFSNVSMDGPFVFIAGGIGITPLMGMLRFMKNTNEGKDTLLIYSARTKKDLVFYDELTKMKKQCSFLKVIYVLSEEAVNDYRKEGFYSGRITDQLLKEHISNFRSTKFFLVGPLPMMKNIEKILTGLKIKKENIFKEEFTLK